MLRNTVYILIFRQRRTIVAKLQQGVNREKILDDIRDSVGQEFGKIHLVDKIEIGKYEYIFDMVLTRKWQFE